MCTEGQSAAWGRPPDKNQELPSRVAADLRQPLREEARGRNSKTSFLLLPPSPAGFPLGEPSWNPGGKGSVRKSGLCRSPGLRAGRKR